jgi:hypothetical protein
MANDVPEGKVVIMGSGLRDWERRMGLEKGGWGWRREDGEGWDKDDGTNDEQEASLAQCTEEMVSVTSWCV